MSKGPAMDLSSFLDIMTCMLGILILIILLTGIDASQIKVLVPTPREQIENDKRPIYFDCRADSLYLISPEEIKSAVDAKTREIWDRVNQSESEFLKESATTKLRVDGQIVDFTSAQIGKYVLQRDNNAKGYKFTDYQTEMEENGWYAQILKKMDPETQFLAFFVRPDGYDVFKKARVLAWPRAISVSCELVDVNEPILLGHGGIAIRPQ